jgi:hypothetical protein
MSVMAGTLFSLPIALRLGRTGRRGRLWLGVFMLSLLLGNIVSEGWIQLDEARFRHEVARQDKTSVYSRARAWPNGNASLVHIPGKGYHGTD